jgi:halocyanin-like protein
MTGDTPTISRRGVLRAGAASALLASGAGNAAAQEGEGENVRPDWGDWLAESDGGYTDARGQSEVRVTVGAAGNGGNFAFARAGLWVDPGTTVIWEWNGQGGGHNVHAMEGADFISGDPVAEAGTTFEHTFEEPGIVKYQCDPHASIGMKGAVAVGDDVPTVSAQAPAESQPFIWPGGDTGSLVVAVLFGLGAVAGFSVLGAEYLHSRRTQREAEAEAGLTYPKGERGVTAEAAEEEPAVELTPDEFDPVGTASLIVVYFLILVVMWLFMYFVEFLGNGPTVIG